LLVGASEEQATTTKADDGYDSRRLVWPAVLRIDAVQVEMAAIPGGWVGPAKNAQRQQKKQVPSLRCGMTTGKASATAREEADPPPSAKDDNVRDMAAMSDDARPFQFQGEMNEREVYGD
jgi:hypothetical protein